MASGWDRYEKDLESGPKGAFTVVSKGIIWIAGLGLVIMLAGIPLGWFSETAQVAREEFGARATLVKYEWFKDASAELAKKKADIALYEDRLASFERDYGKDHSKWPRDVREQANQARSEHVGVVASYNSLAAEYNSNSSKFNWKNAEGDAPRTIEPYHTK
jgi:hypothetical protein